MSWVVRAAESAEVVFRFREPSRFTPAPKAPTAVAVVRTQWPADGKTHHAWFARLPFWDEWIVVEGEFAPSAAIGDRFRWADLAGMAYDIEIYEGPSASVADEQDAQNGSVIVDDDVVADRGPSAGEDVTAGSGVIDGVDEHSGGVGGGGGLDAVAEKDAGLGPAAGESARNAPAEQSHVSHGAPSSNPVPETYPEPTNEGAIVRDQFGRSFLLVDGGWVDLPTGWQLGASVAELREAGGTTWEWIVANGGHLILTEPGRTYCPTCGTERSQRKASA
ncbi:hypothetical protein G9U51_08460 [Calidifontibacter sp. DB0510]|uniref:Uncharacterized protein n=1 Tax=Metallococcus carri TaxID=1656884 RepID=A0A967B004_9MICO|nr:hypothetical protein [Metallococcus carri]NHN55808.1 hypothetical protein [Metallococcus carri]NOP38504.1 hypothetical protein [Calidifontibacter sp. DB2511S]